MKKTINFALITIFTFFLISCEKGKKTEGTESKEVVTKTYAIDPEHSTMQWTAYKTTDKIPVKGTFKEIQVVKTTEGTSASDALNGMEFEIPVSSIFSNDSIRDPKLKTFFFDVMEKTMKLKGSFSVESENEGSILLTMNGVTKGLPFTYSMSQDTLILDAKMDLNAWEAQNALESINQACLELHTGPDGVSKTWDEVGVSAKILTIHK